MKKEYDNLTDVFNENNAFRRAYEQDITECYAAINVQLLNYFYDLVRILKN